MPEIGASGVVFTKVAREWRCKYAMDKDGTPAVSTAGQRGVRPLAQTS